MKVVRLHWRRTGFLAIFLFFLTGAIVHAQTEPQTPPAARPAAEPGWQITMSPYLWLEGMNGNLNVTGHQVKIDQSFTDIMSHLKFGVMGLSEARHGKWGILTDLLFARIGSQEAVAVEGLPNAVDVKATLTTLTFTPSAAYRVYENRRLSADALAGIRFYHLGAELNVNAGASGKQYYSGSDNWVDGVAGGRLAMKLTPRVGAFLIGDAGAGGSKLTWQTVPGIGYKLTERTTLQFGYRRLYTKRQHASVLATELTQQGFVLGAAFRLK
jgi:hypothetical protein